MLWVVRMAESQEHKEIADNAVSINGDAATPTRVVRAADPVQLLRLLLAPRSTPPFSVPFPRHPVRATGITLVTALVSH